MISTIVSSCHGFLCYSEAFGFYTVFNQTFESINFMSHSTDYDRCLYKKEQFFFKNLCPNQQKPVSECLKDDIKSVEGITVFNEAERPLGTCISHVQVNM